ACLGAVGALAGAPGATRSPAHPPPAGPIAAHARPRRPARCRRRRRRVSCRLRGGAGGAVRVLIVLPGALGDVVRALPLLGRIRSGRPAARIGWAVEPLSAPLLTPHPRPDEVLVFRREEGLLAIPPFIRQLRAGRWEIALDLGRGLKSAFLARATRAPVRIAFGRHDAREGGWLLATRRLPAQGIERPKLEQSLAFGDALGLPAVPVAFGLEPSGQEAAPAAALVARLRPPRG